ncbi:MAG: hypothetical protein JSS66_13910 [Armatimonadetes bacterium]|nr:hypothetical protein [Armatimonadota bacterium]
MKGFFPLAAGGLFLAGVMAPVKPVATTTLVIGGDVLGYLAPCGCSQPMIGGVKRWAERVRELRGANETIIVFNGGLVSGNGRQDELKADMLAESLGALKVVAVNLTSKEAGLTRGELSTVERLSGHALVSSNLEASETIGARGSVASGPFLIGAVVEDPEALARQLGETAIPTKQAVESLVEESRADGKKAVLLAYFGLDEARKLAQSNPELALIVYRADSPERTEPIVENGVTLVSPGAKGRYSVSIDWDGHKFVQYRAIQLGPDTHDHEDVARSYDRYLERVTEEKLLDMAPRTETEKFAGNKACARCHSAAAKVWKGSKHALALHTLEEVKHDRDPDCVGCHVVGLESVQGFKSRSLTPGLTDVGCESCHGPGDAHTLRPRQVKMPQVTERKCVSCHNSENSPNFNFSKYWPKIKH